MGNAAACSCHSSDSAAPQRRQGEVDGSTEVYRSQDDIEACSPTIVAENDSGIVDSGRKDFASSPHIGVVAAEADMVSPLTDGAVRTEAQEPMCELGDSRLVLAVAEGRPDAVSLLLQQGACKESRDAQQRTPLLLAAEKGHLEIACLLVAANAELEATSADGLTALHLAFSNGHADLASMLAHHGASAWTLERCAIESCVKRDLPQSQKLLRCGVNRKRMLNLALKHSHFSLIPLLMSGGVELQPAHKAALNEHLLKACTAGTLLEVQQLVRCTADIECRDSSGLTPLLLACAAGRVKLASFLLKKGTNQDAKDDAGQDVLTLCPQNARAKIAELMVLQHPEADIVDRVAQGLSSGDVEVRIQACHQLGRLPGAAAKQGRLLADCAVHDESAKVLAAARDALLAIRSATGAIPCGVVQCAEEAVRGDKVAEALKGCQLLVMLGLVEVPGSLVMQRAREGLAHHAKTVRVDACSVLGSMGMLMQPHMPQLLEAYVCDENFDVRRAAGSAVVALRKAGVPLPESVIRQTLAGTSVQKAAALHFLLAEMGEDKTFAAAVAERAAAGLREKESETRKAACSALAKLGEVAAKHVPALVEVATKDAMWDVRVAALQALGSMRQGHSAPPQVKVLVDRANHDSNRVVRNTAVEALDKMRREGVDLPSPAKQTLKTWEMALKACGSASMPRAR